MDKPIKLEMFMYALTKESRLASFMDFIEEWEISEEEYKEIRKWFIDQADIAL